MVTKKRYKLKQKVRSPKSKIRYFFLIIIFILIYLFVRGDQGFWKYIQLQQEKKRLFQQIEALKKENEQIINEIELLTKNYRYIEKKARELHYMGKKGEKIYIISAPKN